jgi:predicted metal-dependent peptidase
MNSTLPDRVLAARFRLMLGHSYLSAALARLPVINAAELGWCDTMATDGYYIYVNPSFCETLTDEEITAVFAHEVLHCVLGHIDRRNARDRILWNIAIDYATNLLLRDFGFKLPASGLLDPRYRGQTAEEIYEILRKDPSLAQALKGFDAHIEPGDEEGLSQRAEDFPSMDERRRLRSIILRELAKEWARKGRGNMPGELQREIGKASKPQVSWQTLLARFMSGLRRSDYRLCPFNKKHLWRGIYLPSLGIPGPDHLVLAVDTSGSVSPTELGQFVAELDRLRSLTECRLTLLHCDAAIQRIDEIPAGEATILPASGGAGRRLCGGGGTDFRPVFDWVAKQGQPRPDAVIYCTDGFGTFPPRVPAYPVVWVVTARGLPQFPFGMALRLKEE